jgi:hypothetical protein
MQNQFFLYLLNTKTQSELALEAIVKVIEELEAENVAE